jgi:hypothetical protein
VGGAGADGGLVWLGRGQTLSGPQLISRVVGQTEGNLRRVFDEARARGPTLMLIDEVDALCAKREASTSEVEKRYRPRFGCCPRPMPHTFVCWLGAGWCQLCWP